MPTTSVPGTCTFPSQMSPSSHSARLHFRISERRFEVMYLGRIFSIRVAKALGKFNYNF